MRNAGLGLLAALALASPALAALAAPAAAPAAFQGWWVGQEAACAAWADDSQVEIGPRHIRFYAGEGPITRVERRGRREIVIHALIRSGEDDSREATAVRFRLSPDGRQLTEIGEDSSFARKRCPGTP
jgi:hypothetical protein